MFCVWYLNVPLRCPRVWCVWWVLVLQVKPGMPYLDVIRRLKESSHLPISAYHVSGEYAMMKAAVERGWLDERAAVLEVMLFLYLQQVSRAPCVVVCFVLSMPVMVCSRERSLF